MMKHKHLYPVVALEDDSLSIDAQRALCLVKSFLPEIEDFEDYKEDKHTKIAEQDDEITKYESAIDNGKKEISSLKSKIKKLKNRLKKKKDDLRELIHKPWKFFLIRWIWFLFCGGKWRYDYNMLREEINEMKHRYFDLKSAIADEEEKIIGLKEKINGCEDSISSLQSDLEMLPEVPQILSGIGEVDLPLIPLKLMEKETREEETEAKEDIYTYIDLQGEKHGFTVPYLDIDYDVLLKELHKIESFHADEVLISPSDSEKGKWGDPGELLGKEKDLFEAIKNVKESIEQIDIKIHKLPVVKSDTPFADMIKENINKVHLAESDNFPGDVDELFLAKHKEIESEEEAVCNFLNEDFAKVRTIDNRLQTIKEEISDIHTETSTLRKESSTFLSQFLQDMKYYSELAGNYYYCPKCNITNDYLKEVIGIEYENLADFEKLTTEDLKADCLSFLHSEIFDDESGRRISKDEQEKIEQSWNIAFDKMETIEDEITVLLQEDEKAESNVYKMSLMREILTKKQLYRNIAMSILKNHRSEWRSEKVEVEPGEEISLNLFKDTKKYYKNGTKLKYSIEEMNWTCPYCESEFDYEEAKMGAADKIVYDLEIPVLNTLWNDEQVWGQLVDLHKDISREHRDRMVEESNSIQDAINQFLADSRQLRQTIQKRFAKSSAAINRVKNIEDKFNKFDLLDDNTIKELRSIVGQNSKKLEMAHSLLEEMDSKENDLSKAPKLIAFETQLAMADHLDKNIKQLEKEEQ